MKIHYRFLASWEGAVVAVCLTLANIASGAPATAANPFERSIFGDEWDVLGSDVFFGGVDALFGLSPAHRTLLISADAETKTNSEQSAVLATDSSRDARFSFTSLLGSTFTGSRSGSGFAPAAPTATAYFFSGALDSLWSADATWGPTTSGFPNAQGDVALNLLSVSSNVFQDVGGGVTVGTIDHHPTSALNAGPGVNWLITTNNPITLNQDGAGLDTARISNTQTVKINSLTIDGPGGLTLADNLEITNLNALGGVVNIATNISGLAGNNVTMVGPGAVLLTHFTTYQGTTTINSGTLHAGAFNALGGTSTITVNAGGTLLLSGTTANRINNSAGIVLNGGEFNSAGLIEGAASTPGMGALTLLSSSVIDLANGASLLAFANSSAETWTGTLSIHNWTGTVGVGNGTDQLYFGSDATGLTGTQLGQILFFSDDGTNLLGSGLILSDGEVVPVPEPSTWAAAALAFGAIAFLQRRRFRGLLARRS
jgi:MYXO-CTERM domain-containing protein